MSNNWIDIIERVSQTPKAELERARAERRALYGDIDPFAVAPFVRRWGDPLSDTQWIAAAILHRGLRSRLPGFGSQMRFELVKFLGARDDGDRYASALHLQKLDRLLVGYAKRIGKRGILSALHRARPETPSAQRGEQLNDG
jgi:hypothetical protein